MSFHRGWKPIGLKSLLNVSGETSETSEPEDRLEVKHVAWTNLFTGHSDSVRIVRDPSEKNPELPGTKTRFKLLTEGSDFARRGLGMFVEL